MVFKKPFSLPSVFSQIKTASLLDRFCFNYIIGSDTVNIASVKSTVFKLKKTASDE